MNALKPEVLNQEFARWPKLRAHLYPERDSGKLLSNLKLIRLSTLTLLTQSKIWNKSNSPRYTHTTPGLFVCDVITLFQSMKMVRPQQGSYTAEQHARADMSRRLHPHRANHQNHCARQELGRASRNDNILHLLEHTANVIISITVLRVWSGSKQHPPPPRQEMGSDGSSFEMDDGCTRGVGSFS